METNGFIIHSEIGQFSVDTVWIFLCKPNLSDTKSDSERISVSSVWLSPRSGSYTINFPSSADKSMKEKRSSVISSQVYSSGSHHMSSSSLSSSSDEEEEAAKTPKKKKRVSVALAILWVHLRWAKISLNFYYPIEFPHESDVASSFVFTLCNWTLTGAIAFDI